MEVYYKIEWYTSLNLILKIKNPWLKTWFNTTKTQLQTSSSPYSVEIEQHQKTSDKTRKQVTQKRTYKNNKGKIAWHIWEAEWLAK